jgi:DnaK suppressor protein
MPAKKLTKKELDDFHARLRTMLALLSGDIDHLEAEALGDAAATKESLRDGGTDGYYQEFSLQLLERDETAMREVIDALDRIENGGYGNCESCDQAIAKERLRMVPHARNCIECQRKEEEGAA